MDPTSPSKVRKLGVNSKVGDVKDRLPKRILDGQRLKEKPRHGLLSEPKSLNVPKLDKIDLELEKPRPETPTPDSGDGFIPDASEVRSESKDNLPSDHDPDSSSTKAFDFAERTTRRPRGSVSYAEPNLRAKMRRPNRDLADAVKAGEQSKNAVVIPDGESEGQNDNPAEKGGLRTVIIKKENFVDSSDPWQIPSSAEDQNNHLDRLESQAINLLESKANAQPIDEPIDKKPPGEQMPAEKIPENKPSGAGSAIAALSAGRQPKSKKRDEDECATSEMSEAQKDLIPSDFKSTTDCSSTDGLCLGEEAVAGETISAAGVSKRETSAVDNILVRSSHRRHSSMPREREREKERERDDGKLLAGGGGGGGGLGGGDARPSSLAVSISMAKRREQRKRESLVSSASTSASASTSTQEGNIGSGTGSGSGTEIRTARSVSRLSHAGGAGGGRGAGGVDGPGATGRAERGDVGGTGTARAESRAERAASRRRSMLL